MSAVGPLGTIWYGFNMVFTVLMIILFGVVPAAFGAKMFMDGGSEQGLLLIGFGVLIVYSGSLGLMYKVIADAVAKGNESVQGPDLSRVEDYLEEINEKLDEPKDPSKEDSEESEASEDQSEE